MGVISKMVSASLSDMLVQWTGAAWDGDRTSTSNGAGYKDATHQKQGCGMGFAGITIPSGAKILSAYITCVALNNLAGNNANTVLIGEKTASATLPFANIADYQARRGTVVGGATDDNITSASVTWNAIAGWTAESTYDSPDISSIIQELVDTYNGLSNANVVIFWDDHADNSTHADFCFRNGHSYDSDDTKAPTLNITYSMGGITKFIAGGLL